MTSEVEGKEFVPKDHSGEKLPSINDVDDDNSNKTGTVLKGRPAPLTSEQNKKMKHILLIWVLRMIKDQIIYHHLKVGNMVVLEIHQHQW